MAGHYGWDLNGDNRINPLLTFPIFRLTIGPTIGPQIFGSSSVLVILLTRGNDCANLVC